MPGRSSARKHVRGETPTRTEGQCLLSLTKDLGGCEFASETNLLMIRAILRVTDKGGYSWVQCNSCDGGWQVPYYAESVG
jgi:hypothetical protein